MAKIGDHEFPEDRLYDIENQVWYVPLSDGTARAGFTPLSMTLAGDALVFTPKRVGKPFWRDKWFAMVECGKWIGAARAAFDGVLVGHNDQLVAKPILLNRDAFGEGWMAILKPDAPDWRDGLVTGPDLLPRLTAWYEQESYKDRTG